MGMKIGIIGTERIGTAAGKIWSAAGHEVRLAPQEQSVAEAVAWCDVALLACAWFEFTDVEREIGDRLDGKVVIDCINPLKSSGSLALGHKWSAGEEIAKIWHRAKVVKGFNHVPYQVFGEAHEPPLTAFYCSNSDEAKQMFVRLAAELGLDPVDAGPIKNARLLEPLGALQIQLAYKLQFDPALAFTLVRSQ